MPTNLSRFSYYPIPEDGSIIHLTKPLSGKSRDPICVELFDANLRNNSGFGALSYAWGDESHQNHVICKGQTIEVTENLAAALGALRDQHHRGKSTRQPGE